FIGEIEYGFTPWWRSGLGVGTTRLPNESYRLDEIEWENTFLLTEPGQYWLDLGLFAEFAYDYPVRRRAIALGPMIQKAIGAQQVEVRRGRAFRREQEHARYDRPLPDRIRDLLRRRGVAARRFLRLGQDPLRRRHCFRASPPAPHDPRDADDRENRPDSDRGI